MQTYYLCKHRANSTGQDFDAFLHSIYIYICNDTYIYIYVYIMIYIYMYTHLLYIYIYIYIHLFICCYVYVYIYCIHVLVVAWIPLFPKSPQGTSYTNHSLYMHLSLSLYIYIYIYIYTLIHHIVQFVYKDVLRTYIGRSARTDDSLPNSLRSYRRNQQEITLFKATYMCICVYVLVSKATV